MTIHKDMFNDKEKPTVMVSGGLIQYTWVTLE